MTTKRMKNRQEQSGEIALHFICTPCLSHTNDGERPNSEPAILRLSLNEIPHALEWANHEQTKPKAAGFQIQLPHVSIKPKLPPASRARQCLWISTRIAKAAGGNTETRRDYYVRPWFASQPASLSSHEATGEVWRKCEHSKIILTIENRNR